MDCCLTRLLPPLCFHYLWKDLGVEKPCVLTKAEKRPSRHGFLKILISFLVFAFTQQVYVTNIY